MLHPIAESYRQAMADGDHVRAAAIMMDAHSGTYDSRVIDDIHRVGRMTQAELRAPAGDSPADVPVDRNESGRVTVTARIFGRH